MSEKNETKVKDELEVLKKKLEKDFGKGTLISGDMKPNYVEVISTGSIALDSALGVGGLPRGRVVEIYGPESSGKTTLAMHTIAEAHKANPIKHCAFIDVEHAFDITYAKNLGIDISRLQIAQPESGDQALEITDRLVSSGLFDVIVVDSVAALVPESELKKEMGDSSMGRQSMLMSQAMRKLTPGVSKTNTLLIFINQLRSKIGVMFGSPEVTSGGNALKFYSSIRLDIRRILEKDKMLKDPLTDTIIGNPTKVKVVKNKVAPPFKSCMFNIMYGLGIDSNIEALTLGIHLNIINKAGSWYSYGDIKIGQGITSVLEYFKNNPKERLEIVEKLKSSYKAAEFIPIDEDGNETETE